MKYNLALLKSDIKGELEKIEKLVDDFEKVRGKLSLPPDEVPFYDRAAIGYYLHSFYNNSWTKSKLKKSLIPECQFHASENSRAFGQRGSVPASFYPSIERGFVEVPGQ